MTRVFVDRIFLECLTYEGEVVCSPATHPRVTTLYHMPPLLCTRLLCTTGLQDLLGLCIGHGKQKGAAGIGVCRVRCVSTITSSSSLPPRPMFCLSWHNNKALQYLFRLLDIRGQGYLDSFTLSYFFRVSLR